MTIYTPEVPVVRQIELSGIDYVIWIHTLLDIPLNPIVVVVIIGLPVTLQAFPVFFQVFIYPLFFLNCFLNCFLGCQGSLKKTA
jgi:hypothetical protein